jgi:hypothetical protein
MDSMLGVVITVFLEVSLEFFQFIAFSCKSLVDSKGKLPGLKEQRSSWLSNLLNI